MNLITYIENRFQECTFKSQITTEYDIGNDAEIKALHQVLTTYRVVLKWLLVPMVFLDWALVLVGYHAAPKPILVDKMKADKAAQDKKMAKKVGMLSKVADNTTESTPTPA